MERAELPLRADCGSARPAAAGSPQGTQSDRPTSGARPLPLVRKPAEARWGRPDTSGNALSRTCPHREIASERAPHGSGAADSSEAGSNQSAPTRRGRPTSSGTHTDRDDADVERKARRRRQRAALKYRPDVIELLLVAEAPPTALERYFYFEDVPRQDSLFRYVARSILKVEPTRANKRELLGRLRDRGVFLIDLKPDPVDGGSLATEVPGLVRRIRRLDPERIIVIKSSVFDLVREPLGDAGLPIVDERVPFPGSGQQRRFETAFARALRRRPRPR
jgi:hypothetical protein